MRQFRISIEIELVPLFNEIQINSKNCRLKQIPEKPNSYLMKNNISSDNFKKQTFVVTDLVQNQKAI